jgi:hypothetical protein
VRLLRSLRSKTPIIALTFVALPAAGEPKPLHGQTLLSVERAFGLLVTHRTANGGATRETQTVTAVSVFAGRGATFSSQRIALDYVLPQGLSVGGAGWVSLATSRTDTTAEGNTTGGSKGEARALYLAPRIGYLYHFEGPLGLWPRAGLSFVSRSASAEGFSDSHSRHLALTLEAPVMLFPVEHTAVMFTPFWDIGLSHYEEVAGQPADPGTDLWITEYGLQFAAALIF